MPSDNLETTAINDVSKAVSVLPDVVSTIEAAQQDISTAASTHQSIVDTGLQMAGLAATSLTQLANSGVVGHNDAANIDAGVSAVEQVTAFASKWQGMVAEAEAEWNSLKSLFSHIKI